MPGVPKMLRSVFVLRRIAAAHLPAHHAHPQVNPGVTHFHAFFTDVYVGGRDLDLIQVLAFLRHFRLPIIPQSNSFQFLSIPPRKLRSRLVRALHEAEQRLAG
jgi:hypothetical protein